MEHTSFQIEIGEFISPARSNQDRLFTFKSCDNTFIAMCVIDGHGVDGHHVADIVRDTLHEICQTTYTSFECDPHGWLTGVFDVTHEKLFKLYTTGFRVNGGATCTLSIICRNMLYVAHVGDSSALLMTTSDKLNDTLMPAPVTKISDKIFLVSEDHSPENITEHKRMVEIDPTIRCVYDDQRTDKYKLKSVFDSSSRRTYNKNVRGDPATYVVNQSNKSLSVTRSLGDFELKPIVTHIPTIIQIDISGIIGSACLTICSDGVWDNWKYEDVCDFLLDDSCLNALIVDNACGVQRITDSFKIRNNTYASRNFGTHRDDASGIVAYF